MKDFRIHPATILFLILLAITGFSAILLPYIIAITLHEIGHACVAKKLGYQLDKVWILPFGACISFEEFSFNPDDEVKIAFAGPVVNIILIVLTMTLWWVFPQVYVYTYSFALANFSIALFNLLPAYPLDGGRILTGILRNKIKPKRVYKVACVLNLLFSFIFLIFFIVSCFNSINYSIGLIGIFLFLSTFEGKFQGKYSPLIYEFSKSKKKSPMKVKNFCVSSKTPFFRIIPEINRYKYNIIYVIYDDGSMKIITQEHFQRILENNSIEKCFDNIKGFD